MLFAQEIELVLLFLLSLNLVLRLVWLEWKLFLRSRGMFVVSYIAGIFTLSFKPARWLFK